MRIAAGRGGLLKLKHRADPETTAIAALTFIAGDPERLVRFLSATGLTPQTLRAAASEPQFYGQVLDHVASDEALLLAFAANEGLRPEAVADAYRVLNASHEG